MIERAVGVAAPAGEPQGRPAVSAPDLATQPDLFPELLPPPPEPVRCGICGELGTDLIRLLSGEPVHAGCIIAEARRMGKEGFADIQVY